MSSKGFVLKQDGKGNGDDWSLYQLNKERPDIISSSLGISKIEKSWVSTLLYVEGWHRFHQLFDEDAAGCRAGEGYCFRYAFFQYSGLC